MLSGSGLGDDVGAPHFAGQQDLADGVVDLVRSGVVQLLAFEVDPCAVLGAEPRREVQRRRPTGIVFQQGGEFCFELRTFEDFDIPFGELVDVFFELVGDEGAAERAVVTVFVYVVVHGI